MNPLENLYEIIDDLKSDGKVKLAYNRRAKQICIIKERSLMLEPLYDILKAEKIPYVPEIYRLVKFEDKLFVVEEYISGQTLDEILKYEETFSEEDAAGIMRQICEALQFLHSCKIIHRDIKPSNIMLTRDGFIRLIDFGISRIAKDDSDTDTDFLGTKGYAPPEQFGFGQTDSRSDIYSLGVLTQRLLGKDYRGWLKKIINHCTEFDPDNRYDSANALFDDLTRNSWREDFKNLSKPLDENSTEDELNLYGKLEELTKKIEDIDAMYENYEKVKDADPLRAKLIENAMLATAEEFQDVAYSFTDEEIAEIDAALEEYPLEDFDSDTKI